MWYNTIQYNKLYLKSASIVTDNLSSSELLRPTYSGYSKDVWLHNISDIKQYFPLSFVFFLGGGAKMHQTYIFWQILKFQSKKHTNNSLIELSFLNNLILTGHVLCWCLQMTNNNKILVTMMLNCVF